MYTKKIHLRKEKSFQQIVQEQLEIHKEKFHFNLYLIYII